MSFVYLAVFFSAFALSQSDIVFPDSYNTSEKGPMEIPLHIIRRINEVSNVEEFYQNMIEPVRSSSQFLPHDITARIGSDYVERSSLQMAKMAKCMPELRTIPLNNDTTTATFYYPSCTRIERCGGCCSHHLLSCQPVESEYIPMSVVVADYSGGNKLNLKGQKTVHVERHTKCKCECKIRPESCKGYQKYNPHKCQCECTNTDEEKKCSREWPKKIWSPNDCLCVCKEELECGSGYYFDLFTCSCELSYRGRKKPSFVYHVN